MGTHKGCPYGLTRGALDPLGHPQGVPLQSLAGAGRGSSAPISCCEPLSMLIETERLLLRSIQPADVPDLVGL